MTNKDIELLNRVASIFITAVCADEGEETTTDKILKEVKNKVFSNETCKSAPVAEETVSQSYYNDGRKSFGDEYDDDDSFEDDDNGLTAFGTPDGATPVQKFLGF